MQERNTGQRLNIIIVAEGAIDLEGKAITPDYIREVSKMLTAAANYFVQEHTVGIFSTNTGECNPCMTRTALGAYRWRFSSPRMESSPC